MIGSAIGKVMWVGRATVFLVGLAVIIALVVGAATTALGTTGQSFILGKANNTAETPTGLLSTLSDAAKSALIVTNKSGGSALELRVGNPSATPPIPANSVSPMKVNSNKVVTNLNADRLDGMDSSAFLPGGDLPSGRTVRGSYAVHGQAPPDLQAREFTAISFGYRLASEPDVRIIKMGATPSPECPGTVRSPEAMPGYLCLYEEHAAGLRSSSPLFIHLTPQRATLEALSETAPSNDYLLFHTYGTWAVTGT